MTQTATPVANTIGLQTRALLVNLHISMFSGYKHDKKITKEVADSHNATDAGRYNKLLVAKEKIEKIQKATTAARTYHITNTLPWGDNGDRLLPSANFDAYTREMITLKSNYENEVRGFIDNYDAVLEDAKQRLNGMFNAEDYPNKPELETRFKFVTNFSPLAETDFRVDLPQTALNNLTQQVENMYKERTASAVLDIWKRIKEQLEAMRDRFTSTTKDKDGNEVPVVFRNSLFENLKDIIDLMPRLNVTGSPEIDEICNDMKALVIDPDKVRESATIRNRKAEEVTAILNKFDAFFN